MADSIDIITEGFGDLDQLGDARLEALSRRTLLTAQLAALRAVGHVADAAAFPLPERTDALEHVFAARLAAFVPRQRDAVVARLLPQARAVRTGAPNRFAGLARIDVASSMPVADQARRRAGPTSAIGASELGRLVLGQPAFANNVDAPDDSTATERPVGHARVVRDKLALRLHDVRCVGETGTWFEETFGGADEIDAATIAIDESGNVSRHRPFHVGDFEEGQRVRYNPPNRITTFRLDGPDVWPKHYFAFLLLAEIDFGGFADFVAELYDRLRDQVADDLADLLKGDPNVGPDTHGLAEAIGEALGELIGGIAAIVLPILGKLIDWIVNALGDEVFRPRLLHVRLDGPTSTFRDGRTTTGTRLLRYVGHDGEYHVHYSWERFA